MKRPTKTEMQALITVLRAIAPKRALTYGESLQVGRVQAARLRRWANAVKPDINLIWLTQQRLIPVNFVASHKLGEQSGLTTDQVGGRLQMFVNEGEPLVRQRFSLLHEFKHAIDFDDAPKLHAKLGRGNAKVQAGQIEAICNDFAAHILMPTPLVKREWFTWRELSVVANTFNVSVEAMATRLEKLGILGDPKPKPRVYFRRAPAARCLPRRACRVTKGGGTHERQNPARPVQQHRGSLHSLPACLVGTSDAHRR